MKLVDAEQGTLGQTQVTGFTMGVSRGQDTAGLRVQFCHLSRSPVPDAATRKFSAQQVPVVYSAMAMVSEPGLARVIMNLRFALQPPPIPMRNFTAEQQARVWLRQFLKASNT